MDIEQKLEQLTGLMSDLVPTVDKLASEVQQLTASNKKANVERSELRLSNIRVAEAIEKLNSKIDRLEDLESRVKRLEEKPR